MLTETKTTDEQPSEEMSEEHDQQQPRRRKSRAHQDGSKPWPVDNRSSYASLWEAFTDMCNSLTYTYMNPILEKGRNQFKSGDHIDVDDLFEVPPHMSSAVLVSRFW